MAGIEVILPQMGESVAEATITNWLVAPGQTIEEDDPIVEIATDKVDSEIPCPVAGTVSKLLFEEGEVAKVGQAIAVVIPVDQEVEAEPAKSPVVDKSEEQAAEEVPYLPSKPVPSATVASNANRFYSPLVRKIAQEEGIEQAELDDIPGTGKGGRVTKNDMLDYVGKRKSTQTVSKGQSAPKAESVSASPAPAPATVTNTPANTPTEIQAKYEGQNVEIIEMDRMRKLISDHMVHSNRTAAHVTSFVEADVTNLVAWRNKVKDKFLSRDGEKLTFTPLFVEAVTRAIKDFPMINSSVEGQFVIRRNDINIGMATALPNGNLIVPVIKGADGMNLIGLTKKVNDLANRARSNALAPDEIQGGTFTLTNVGTFGSIMGTPIINQPQVAILAVGAIRKKPAVIETPMGDTIGIRHMMFLSMSYDHRIIDGALGSQYLKKVADYLEQWDLYREI